MLSSIYKGLGIKMRSVWNKDQLHTEKIKEGE
jgi:hypothetical protein